MNHRQQALNELGSADDSTNVVRAQLEYLSSIAHSLVAITEALDAATKKEESSPDLVGTEWKDLLPSSLGSKVTVRLGPSRDGYITGTITAGIVRYDLVDADGERWFPRDDAKIKIWH